LGGSNSNWEAEIFNWGGLTCNKETDIFIKDSSGTSYRAATPILSDAVISYSLFCYSLFAFNKKPLYY
jgi:hypothetical protein